MVDVGSQIIPSPDFPQAHPKSHQPIRGPSSQAQRSTGHSSRWKLHSKDQEEWMSSLGPSQDWLQEPASASRHDTQDESVLGCLWDLRVLLPRVVWLTMGCVRTAFWNCLWLIMGCAGEEPKVGKGVGSGDLWRSNSGENRGIRE